MAPHYQGLIELNDGPLDLSLLTDCYGFEPIIGDVGIMVTRRIVVESSSSLIVYGYKFQISRQTY